jgi:lipoate-protein ligase A
MAMDEVLLDWAAGTEQCGWRFYGWKEPTLSLGYFQPYEERFGHPASGACPVVRRASGGGAIVHHRELTYSLVVGAKHRLARRRQALYETIHATLIDTMAAWGIRAELCRPQDGPEPQRQPFLCFQRRSAGDVLVGSAKVAGSAQRRRGGAVLQHGSILLARSHAAPELDGLADLASAAITADRLFDVWRRTLAGALNLAWQSEPYSESELLQAEALARDKYETETWTRKRRS